MMQLLRHVIDEHGLQAEERELGPHLRQEQDAEAARVAEPRALGVCLLLGHTSDARVLIYENQFSQRGAACKLARTPRF